MNALPVEINLTISDPFQFPLNRLTAVAQEKKGQALLLNLKEGVTYKNSNIVQLVAFPRNIPDAFNLLKDGRQIVVNLTPIIGENKLSLDSCLELAKKWRGWFLMGTVEISNSTITTEVPRILQRVSR